MVECPLHKVAKTDFVSETECQSCEFFGEDKCPANVFDDLQDEMMEATAKTYNKIKKILKKGVVK
mgnify:FL=1